MQNISSETLFHFTNFENLRGILKNEFYPKYSLEVLDFEGKTPAEFAYAMICFCDIPLSRIKGHLKHYGNYGIGMSKEWVMSKKLNPVMYIRKGSSLSTWLYSMLNSSNSLKAAENPIAAEIKAGLSFMLRYVKSFEGKSNKNGDNVKFYNEREWRYIPFIFEDDELKQTLVNILTKEEFKGPNCLQKNNKEVERFKLGFDPKDIKYIIVEKEHEVLEMVEYLHNVKSKYDNDTIKILTSRIITSEQIKNDF